MKELKRSLKKEFYHEKLTLIGYAALLGLGFGLIMAVLLVFFEPYVVFMPDATSTTAFKFTSMPLAGIMMGIMFSLLTPDDNTFKKWLKIDKRASLSMINHYEKLYYFREEYAALSEAFKPADWDYKHRGPKGEKIPYIIPLDELQKLMKENSIKDPHLMDKCLDIMNIYNELMAKELRPEARQGSIIASLILDENDIDNSIYEYKTRVKAIDQILS